MGNVEGGWREEPKWMRTGKIAGPIGAIAIPIIATVIAHSVGGDKPPKHTQVELKDRIAECINTKLALQRIDTESVKKSVRLCLLNYEVSESQFNHGETPE